MIPSEICDIYPASHNVIPQSVLSGYETEDYTTFVESLTNFVKVNHFEEIIIIADTFMHKILGSKKNTIIRDHRPLILDHKDYIAKS